MSWDGSGWFGVVPGCRGSLPLQGARGEERVSGEGPYLLTLKLLSRVENGGGDRKEEAGPGKGVAIWAEGTNPV